MSTILNPATPLSVYRPSLASVGYVAAMHLLQFHKLYHFKIVRLSTQSTERDVYRVSYSLLTIILWKSYLTLLDIESGFWIGYR